MFGAGYQPPAWRRCDNSHWRKSRPWDELDARHNRDAEDRAVIRSLCLRPRKQSTPERKAQAERLLKLRAELRASKDHERQYKALADDIKGWTLDQIMAATLWDKLERHMSGPGLDAWERSLLAAQRLKADPELVKVRAQFRKHPYDSKGHAKRLPAKLYAVFADTRYMPPCRSSKQVRKDIEAAMSHRQSCTTFPTDCRATIND